MSVRCVVPARPLWPTGFLWQACNVARIPNGTDHDCKVIGDQG